VRGDLPTGTVTFLFTDIEGSTRLLHELGPDAYGEALAEHRRVLRGAFAAHGGVEVDTQGDAFFVAFPTAAGAAAAALSAQVELAHGPISVRMGLHTGAPSVTSEGYVGIDVHRGARVAALAHGGQILVSPATASLLHGPELRDLGLHRLKDFDGAVRVLQLGLDEFPPLRTPGSLDLPTPATRFLGREHELSQAVSLVYDRDPRILTILGPGGTGKTRFALELARLLADDAEGGTVFVALAPLRDPELVLPTIADRVGAGSGEPEAIAARIGDRRTRLLCDNIEHLLPAAARPLAELATAAPTLRLFTTSREPLRVQGEVELDLPPLADDEGVSFFLERARAVRPDVEPDRAVRALCTRLDNLPLALELAAARTKLLSPERLLDRLEQRLDLLKGTRDADERHATLRATIAWSYDLLNRDEQTLFRRLSVFRGGCTFESAEIVCDADLDTLASLLDKSLVRRRTGRLGEERFWMLETIREFAIECLEASGEIDAIRRRHADRMLEIAQEAHLSEDDDEPFDLQSGLADREDFRAALDWSVTADPRVGLELSIALEHVWVAHAPAEGAKRTGLLLDSAGDIPVRLRARGLRVLAGASYLSGDSNATRLHEQSLELFRQLDDERSIAQLLHRLASGALDEDPALARRYLDESAAISRGRYPLVDCTNVYIEAQLALIAGDLPMAMELTKRSEALAAQMGWDWWRAVQLNLLAKMAVQNGLVDEAERAARAALRLERQQENRLYAAHSLAYLARALFARGEVELAGTLWGSVEDEVSYDRAPELAATRQPAFTAARERGRLLDVWEAVEIGLDEDGAHTLP
jgi:predicted ATPase/class 3 adenylate cyclase